MFKRWKSKRKHVLCLSVCIESNFVEIAKTTFIYNKEQILSESLKHFDPTPYFTDKNGERLIEYIAQLCRSINVKSEETYSIVALSIPGAVADGKIKRASRLKIFNEIDIKPIFRKNGFDQTFIFKDVECLALGEFIDSAGNIDKGFRESSFIYIYADEGVGAAWFLNGSVYRGAGFAGPLGRLIVEPDGMFNDAFKSHGALEAFTGRPFISQGIVNHFKSEFGKQKEDQTHEELIYRSRLEVACDATTELTFSDFCTGERLQEPNTTVVLNRAYKYMALALNAVVTILNPPLIVLGGRFFTELPNSIDKTLDYARRYSWEHAWNSSEFRKAKVGRKWQHIGLMITFLISERKL